MFLLTASQWLNGLHELSIHFSKNDPMSEEQPFTELLTFNTFRPTA
jgi:hypothetical protein